VAAQFAAYVWYDNTQGAGPGREEKARFAEENWRPFVPVAPEGLGRLLLKIAAGRPGQRRRRKRPYQALAGVPARATA
jgi:hypothetical protein